MSAHRKVYVSELGYERPRCLACGIDWPCPPVAEAREKADEISPIISDGAA